MASCPNYDGAEEALRNLLAKLGGMERFVAPGQRVLLKANLLRPSPPETAVCTHPAVVAAASGKDHVFSSQKLITIKGECIWSCGWQGSYCWCFWQGFWY